MKIAVLKETADHETRVAITPEIVKKFKKVGIDVTIQEGAGISSSFLDEHYQEAGAILAKSSKDTVKDADILLCVQTPSLADVKTSLKKQALIISSLPKDPSRDLAKDSSKTTLEDFVANGLSFLALEHIPRITRAQSMDTLSSQANLGGYRAVIEAVFEYGRALPMMMTAAGTVPPAKVLVVGAGVAGLQAIATAKRLGAVVSAFDVRAAAKEQVESLGAKFIDVEADSDDSSETSGGYAKETSKAYQKRQAEKMAKSVAASDIVITTALIPGKPAPRLVDKSMIDHMKPGSVLVDMATERGGNIEGSKKDKIVTYNDTKIIGFSNLPGRLPAESSTLFARNLFHLVSLLHDKEANALKIDQNDEIIKQSLVVYNGNLSHSEDSKTNTDDKQPEKDTATSQTKTNEASS